MHEEDFILDASSYLRNFKRVGLHKYAFACNLCGDSQKVRSKARGSLYIYENKWFFHCFNCGVSLPFVSWLEEVSPDLADQYRFKMFGKKKRTNNQTINSKPDVHNIEVLQYLQALSSSLNHPAVTYLKARSTPDHYIDTLYYTPNFKKFVCDHIDSGKYKHTTDPDPRIVVPIYNVANTLVGVQGRTINPEEKIRYFTMKIADNESLTWNINNIDVSKPVFVMEGIFDAMLIDNAVAILNSSLYTVPLDKDNCILVWDNEPRNKQIVNEQLKGINKGFDVVIWKNDIQEKDINDMIKAGYTINANTLAQMAKHGLSAELQFTNWRKV